MFSPRAMRSRRVSPIVMRSKRSAIGFCPSALGSVIDGFVAITCWIWRGPVFDTSDRQLASVRLEAKQGFPE